ncbi:sulfotransferase [Tropicimonas sp. IMCC34043]|uniref:tetratricopeptide repeat-containing sulfotransferase family protein n=1 Tax=Tropicimonas sp. IMCC34043 TaxID=2248760 RepID=UPI000E23AFF3|nr:sulfotransferase [Tropicimonas sp. IMCC34043]
MLPLDPKTIPDTYKRGLQLQKAGRLDEARALHASIVAAAPGMFEAHFQLGRIDFARGDAAAAVAHLETARKLRPDEVEVLRGLASAYEAAGRIDEALALHDDLIRRLPKQVRPLADKALVLQRTGDFDAAEAQLRKALKLAPLEGQLYRMLTSTRKLKKGDPLIGAMQKAHADKRVTGRSRIQLQFALAKAMEDSGQFDRVFRYLNPANAAMHAAFPYDIARRKSEVDQLIATFRGHDFTPVGPGPEGFAPIFVTGMPRSGTTLVEQILASHPDVTAGDEMLHGLRLAYGLIGEPEKGFRPMASLAPEQIAAFGQAYSDAVRRSVSFAARVTDKSIQTHLIIGLLKQAIPNARFLVVRRDPRDLLYSIYKNLFVDGKHLYAYDFQSLAGYYQSFLKILEFWRETIPDAFHEVVYEDLVAEPEAQTRALIAAAGLDWDPACLSFHETKREVKTLSIQQVRQPIYRSSAQAWEKFSTELQPLSEALEREGVL